MRAFAFAVLALSLAGCSSSDFEPGTQQDSGSSSDTMAIPDTGSPEDSSTVDSTVTDSSGTDSSGDDSAKVDSGSPVDSATIDSSHDTGADTATPETSTTDECASEFDCRIFDSYCTTALCECIPLKKTAPNPVCSGGMMGTCFIAPCSGKKATCASGKCTVAPAGSTM